MRPCKLASWPATGAALLLAHGLEAQPPQATALTGVAPAHCVTALERREAPDPLRCPAALHSAIAAAQAMCADAGGRLSGATEGKVWALDVDDDGRRELAFELDGNVTCADSWSLFSCGSMDCPKALYALRGGEWTVVGQISATWPEQVMLGTARSADGHRSLEVCPEEGCPERWIYEWRDESYAATRVEVRDTRVDVAGSVRGLHPLAAETTVRATPRTNGADVGRYSAGTDVEIIGTAGDWFYVAPCNACDNGFVPRTAVLLR